MATGDVDGDGAAEVVVGAGPGGGPHVRALGGSTGNREVASFFAYAPGFSGGVYVAAGRVNNFSQLVFPTRRFIVTGAGGGGGPHVRAFGLDGTSFLDFFAYAPSFLGGVRVATGDVTGDGAAEVITGAGPGGGPHVRVLKALPLFGGFVLVAT